MYTPPPARVTSVGETGGWHSRAVASGGETSRVSWRLNDNSASPAVSRTSYLRQVLKHRSQSSSPSSLVQLATRNSPGRLLRNGIGRSPVTVRLAGVKKEEHKPMEVRMDTDQQDQPADPCDKEVVLSALRQRRSVGGKLSSNLGQVPCLIFRKRWASPAREESGSSPSMSAVTSPPMSKRSRY